MQKITARATYNNEATFSKIIETLKRTVSDVQKSFSTITFVVLEIDDIRLKIEVNSDIKTLHEQYEDRMFLFMNGRQKELSKQYRYDGIL
jgi:hypothetical protein